MENVFFVISEVLNAALFIGLIVAVARIRNTSIDLHNAVQALDNELDTTWAAVAHVEDRVDGVIGDVQIVTLEVNALKPAPKPVRKPAAKKPAVKKDVK